MYNFTKEEKKIVKEIIGFYGCKVKFKDKFPGGRYVPEEGIIIGYNNTFHNLICTVFHELGHHLCKQEGRFKVYHSKDAINDIKRLFSYADAAKYCLDAEVYVESIGKKLFKVWFPELKYEGFYTKSLKCEYFMSGLLINLY